MPVKKSNWGIVHLTVGTAGRPLTAPLTAYNPWLKAALYDYGIGRLDVLNNTNADWVFIGNQNQKVLDSLSYSFDLN